MARTPNIKPTRTKSAPKRLAAPQPDAPAAPEQEPAPLPQTLLVPAALILAAETVSSREETRPYLNGVFVHIKDGKGRVIGCDGHRLFVSSFPIDTGTDVEWATKGVIISSEYLKARVSMIQKIGGQLVRITGTKGDGKLILSDRDDVASFKQTVVDGTYPDYDRVIPTKAFSNMNDETGELAAGTEWEPVGINSMYLKHIGEIAKVLDNGLDKSMRSKTGTVVRAFNSGGGAGDDPLVFDFSNQPGALLVLMPVKASKAISNETAALLEGPIKGTIAALRAHATRNRTWADDAKDPVVKQGHVDAAERFDARIAAILAKVPGYAALAAPEPVEAAAEPVADEPAAGPVIEPEDEPDLQPDPAAVERFIQENEDQTAAAQAAADEGITVVPDDDQAEPVEAPIVKGRRKRSVH